MTELIKNHTIAGVVVVYNPECTLIENIQSYLPNLEFLTIVDNSEKINTKIINFFEGNTKIEYKWMKENVGVACALNIGAQLAIERNCDFLLTMDQDSNFSTNALNKLIEGTRFLSKDTIGLLSPNHVFRKSQKRKILSYEEVLFCMTSGNLLNLKVYQKAGKFLEELFIDHIDHEYGLRLNMLGYKVIRANEVTLHHQLGRIKNVTIFGKRIYTFISHTPSRGYYMIRNGFYVANLYKNKYPIFYFLNLLITIKEVIKTLLWEDNRENRLRLLYRGFKDYRSSHMGKLNWY